MTKLDPIVSEFATQEEADAYDKWFRAEVEAALKEEGPGIPHDEVMRGLSHKKKFANKAASGYLL